MGLKTLNEQHLIYFFPNKNLVLSDWNNFYLYQIKPAKCKFSRSLVIHCLPFLFFWFSNRMNHHWYYFFCPQKHGLTTSQNNPALVLFTRLAIYRVSLLLKMSLTCQLIQNIISVAVLSSFLVVNQVKRTL